MKNSNQPENKASEHPLILYLKMSRIYFLAGGLLLYFLGVGIAKYLGYTIDWMAAILGQLWVLTLQLATHFLNEYYNGPVDQFNPNRTPLTGGSGAIGPGKLSRQVALYSALFLLAFLASLTVVLLAMLDLPPEALLIMFLAFLGAVFYSTPPVRLEASGYGELTTSVLIGFLLPAFGFVLQTGSLHRLVAMSAFPLVTLHIAMLIAFEMPDYGTDMKYDKRTLLVRMGWENAMLLHNLMILVSFLLVLVAASFGYPWPIAIAALIPLPLGILQIWQMRQIAQGKKPNWLALALNGLIVFVAVAYMQAFSFWVR
jgi:1,4-dihydroxy-2-naphthoate octaprenyltransferase